MENFQSEINLEYSSGSDSSCSEHSSDFEFINDDEIATESDSSEYNPSSSDAGSVGSLSSGSNEDIFIKICVQGENQGLVQLLIMQNNTSDYINADRSNAEVAFVILGNYLRELKEKQM